VPLFDTVTPRTSGLEATSILTASPALFWYVLFVSVGLAPTIRTPAEFDEAIVLLVSANSPPSTTTMPSLLYAPYRTSQ